MANNTTIPPDAILNPYTPLAFMPPDVADQYQVMLYVYVATFAVSLIQRQTTIELTSYIHRPIRGIGSCRFRKNTESSGEWDSTRLMPRISYQGQ